MGTPMNTFDLATSLTPCLPRKSFAQALVEITAAPLTGTIVSYGQRGYGFIESPDQEEDVYFNIQNVCCDESLIRPGLRVSFRLAASHHNQRPQAVDVKPL
jgi:cold shock CspA family protein